MQDPAPSRLTTVQWLVCIIAAIGFAFDIYELLMLPLIIKEAVKELSANMVDGPFLPGTPNYVHWARMLFFVPAIVGGIFGLLGGYLTDRLGRRRVLTFSILLYAFSAFSAGFAQTLPQLLFFRCLVFIGVCVEFVAAVAWLAELFPDPIRREKVLGFTQAFSSLGGFMVAIANNLSAEFASFLPAIHSGHAAWRYTLISGVIPAIPLILIRPFLPESPAWQRKKELGQLKRPSILALFSPELVRTTLLTTLVFASSYGIAFGAIQQLPQILASGHKQVRAIGAVARQEAIDEAKQRGEPVPAEGILKQRAANAIDGTNSTITLAQEIGGLLGRFALAVIALYVVSRRNLLRIFQIPALIIVPVFFWWLSRNLQSDSLTMVQLGIFLAGFFTVAQFSFWGNYIPLVFPVHLRGTGESFAANIGGRILGTAAAWITLTLSASNPPDPAKMAWMSAAVAGTYCLVGVIATQWLPEPKAGAAED